MRFLKGLSILTLLLVLFGCGEKEKENVLKVWAWDPNFNIKSIELAKESYNKKNPDNVCCKIK